MLRLPGTFVSSMAVVLNHQSDAETWPPAGVSLVAIAMGLNLLELLPFRLPSLDVDVRTLQVPPLLQVDHQCCCYLEATASAPVLIKSSNLVVYMRFGVLTAYCHLTAPVMTLSAAIHHNKQHFDHNRLSCAGLCCRPHFCSGGITMQHSSVGYTACLCIYCTAPPGGWRSASGIHYWVS